MTGTAVAHIRERIATPLSGSASLTGRAAGPWFRPC